MSAPAPLPIEGVWELIRAEMGPESAAEMVAMGVELELTGGRYTVRFAGEISDRGTFELGTTPGVNTLFVHGTEGPNIGRTLPCIFQLVGDRLRICYGLDGVMPTDFGTTAIAVRYLATYRRKRMQSVSQHP
jgi:uncharacterized protein (TIGR03067 family)